MGSPVMWFDIVSADPGRARDFYTQLFDWTAAASLGAVSLNVPRSASSAHVIKASADVGSVTISAH